MTDSIAPMTASSPSPHSPHLELPTTMDAVVLTSEGGPEVLTVDSAPVPSPEPGEVLIQVEYAALNHLDIWIRKGMPSVPKPRIMGADATGDVVAVGDESLNHWLGQRVVVNPGIGCGACRFCARGEQALCDTFTVLGEHRSGTHAGYVCVPVAIVHRAPMHLAGPEAGALGLVYATAWRMLMTRAAVRPGERVVVWGASSGVGAAAIQILSALGVETIATTRNPAKSGALTELGADHVLVGSGVDLVREIKALTSGTGVEVAFDHLGAVGWEASLLVLDKGGRYVTCGATTGASPKAGITRIFWKQLSMLGSTMANYGEFADMLTFIEKNRITPRVDRVFPLGQISEAHERLESAQQIGKIVLAVTGQSTGH